MKETHLFYIAELPADNVGELPPDEAGHAVRVLRMKEGDILTMADGKGRFAEAEITMANPKHCRFTVLRTWPDEKLWNGGIHIAVAPTKNMDRMEWFAEKATEIGMDSLTLLNCANSERRVVKTERLDKIVVSAMKQSHKAYKPAIREMIPFTKFIHRPFGGQKYIAHCYSPSDADGDNGTETKESYMPQLHLSARNFLGDLLNKDDNALVLIGPEGDFSKDEVREAIAAGFIPVSLGESRLRTETAALVAVHLMYLAKRR